MAQFILPREPYAAWWLFDLNDGATGFLTGFEVASMSLAGDILKF
jgi:hypothetical protein